jgi:hypothetical protein
LHFCPGHLWNDLCMLGGVFVDVQRLDFLTLTHDGREFGTAWFRGGVEYVLRMLSAVVRCSWCLVAGNEWDFGRMGMYA